MSENFIVYPNGGTPVPQADQRMNHSQMKLQQLHQQQIQQQQQMQQIQLQQLHQQHLHNETLAPFAGQAPMYDASFPATPFGLVPNVAAPPVQQQHPHVLQNLLMEHFMNNNQEVNKYFLTNPPIFDLSMLLDPPYQSGPHPRRRRISISNGQIHQMIDAFHHLQEDERATSPSTDSSGNNIVDFINLRDPPTSLGAASISPRSHARDISGIDSITPQPSVPPSINSHTGKAIKTEGDRGVPGDRLHVNGSGVPQHQLFYNNELIFNPHGDAPIKGTAAWKRDRLLERNRVAASKCRQRKKMAQEQMERNAEILVVENKELKRNYLKMRANLAKYQKLMQSHLLECKSGSNSLRLLEDLMKIDSEEIKISTSDNELLDDNDV
ncbi:hypothetical protein BABINDRAFT_162405 [Babjeviella inositovora NRRL Y-12698]|uniref:BZIP domain-containing protein n=1 Tax=Babjeviella inositovora NRRL Y-12698 TaxID=984486 RepID=A0A1E3QM65_9ASCO|nr:uncharacterized protein BABINDRAFT_162405 [Babjeviella inositovora NRRL Y-12698]ODQ78708.1 hypothetical protein BABINDRAFT_162405 [Babjeviella inositovora NRRL Y-12698]